MELRKRSVEKDVFKDSLRKYGVRQTFSMLYTGVHGMMAEDPREKIIETLRKHPEGLTIGSIAKLSGLHRHTSAKYVKELIRKKVVFERRIGSAKLCYLRKVSNQEEGDCPSKKGEKGLKIAVILTIAFLLLLQAGIVAQNFSGFLNIPNVSNPQDISGQFVMVEGENNESSSLETDESTPISTTTTSLLSEEEIVEPVTTTSTTTSMPLVEGWNNTVEIDNSTSQEDSKAPSYSFFGASREKAKVGEEVEFFAFWQDDFGLDRWIFSWNSSGSWENESYTFISSYDGETKVFTRHGWKYFKDLSYEDEIAVLSAGEIRWEKPLRIVALPYDDGIYKINGEIDIHVTPNHKVFARIDYPLDFVRRIKDFLFGVDLSEFKFIEVEKAYELAKAGYGITFLDENLKPIYVKQINLESYKGMIYDLTVPSHVILVKRFGKAVWSSNLNVLEAWSNVTKTVNSAGIVSFKFYASDLAGNWVETEEGSLEVLSEISEENVQLKPEIKIEKIEVPSSVNVSEEFEVKAFITSMNGNSSDVFVSLQAPQEFAAEGLQKTLAEIGENESSMISWLLKSSECGNYTLNITAETNESKDFKSFDVLVECEEKLEQQNLLAINAFVSVENVTRGNKTWKFVKVYGNVSLNESIINSNVSVVIKDSKGKIVFQDKKSTDGNFLFSFEFLPKHSGTYTAEIFAETEFGNTGKILSFEILKHLKLKPKIKQEKFNYELGEKIRFEISVVDEDTNELYPNASLKVFVVDPEGNVTEVNFIEDEIEKGKYYVELDAEREFRPGLYKLKVKLNYVSPNPGEVEVEGEIEFSVGLVNI
ncbi:MAG: Hint domain-containing protein, partial [Candidatus Aenigmatarchaeota archaeon]